MRVTISFDVDSPLVMDIEKLRTEMWDYLAKLVRAFNSDNKLQEPFPIARFATAKIEVRR